MPNKITGITVTDGNKYSVIPLSNSVPSITIAKGRTHKVLRKDGSTAKIKRKPIYLYCENLKPNTTYKIKLWYGSNHRGRAQKQYQHPYNTIADASRTISSTDKPEDVEEYVYKQKRCSGIVMGLFNTLISGKGWSNNGTMPNLINASDDELRKYVLQTEWEFSTKTGTSYRLEIEPDKWLQPMYRPDQKLQKDNITGISSTIECYTIVGAASDKGGHLTLKFSLEEVPSAGGRDNLEEYFSNNSLIIGNKIEVDTKSQPTVPAYIKVL